MTHHRSQIDYTYNQLKSIAHNHIMGVEPNDHIMEDAMNQVESSDP